MLLVTYGVERSVVGIRWMKAVAVRGDPSGDERPDFSQVVLGL